MAISDHYYTKDQRDALARRRDALGPEGMRAGGDPGIRESLGRMYREEGVERA